MPGQPRDDEREQRIVNEVIVDAYGPEEQAMGWYYYLEEALAFPFIARCTTKRIISPTRVDEEVEVMGMAPEEECEREIFVRVQWQGHDLGIPLSQLEPVDAEGLTRQGVADWRYWVARGYAF
ncbi:calcium-binding protein [Streptomyces sp. So13.3]|uniref:calcium-binding protein n=1 Tax=Streptomyces TaxID=1883 RepID=UPI001105F405|nr:MULTISPECIES: calcium-binding protein [Streptomyces]MCZ4099013.1 calcium-binding protein [Streptomyces sp. H39-C1]QNA74449.1 calcium-binding protein [Streptomyces sp. So13.3]